MAILDFAGSAVVQALQVLSKLYLLQYFFAEGRDFFLTLLYNLHLSSLLLLSEKSKVYQNMRQAGDELCLYEIVKIVYLLEHR